MTLIRKPTMITQIAALLPTQACLIHAVGRPAFNRGSGR